MVSLIFKIGAYKIISNYKNEVKKNEMNKVKNKLIRDRQEKEIFLLRELYKIKGEL